MPTLYLVAQNPVTFKKTGGWLTAEKWHPPVSVNYFSAAVVGFDPRAMPPQVIVVRSLDDARVLARAGEIQSKRAPDQGYPYFEMDYSGEDIPPAPSASLSSGTDQTTINTYPVDSAKCRFTGAVMLSHIHPSLSDVPSQMYTLADDDSDEVGLVSGDKRPQSRWATAVATVRNAPSNAWGYMKGNRAAAASYSSANQDPSHSVFSRRPAPLSSRLGASLRAFGRSLADTASKWGPVFGFAAVGITLFYLTGGTGLLMKWFLSMGLKSAAAASLTTMGTLAIGIVSVGVCKAVIKAVQAGAHYGKAGYDNVKVRYVGYTESRAKAANEAQHAQALLLAEQLGYDLHQDNDPAAQFEAVYAESDSAHRAKLLERELMLFSQLKANKANPAARQAAEEAALRDLAAIQADVQRARVAAPGVC